MDGPLGLDGGNGGVDILGDNITTVQHAARHVLAMAGITLNHLVAGLETSVGDLRDGQLENKTNEPKFNKFQISSNNFASFNQFAQK